MFALKEVAAGSIAASHGILPLVALPGDNILQSEFNTEVTDLIKDHHIYRRDSVIVLPNDKKKRLDTLGPKTFLSWAESYFIPYKTRTAPGGGEPLIVPKSMSADISSIYLESITARTHLREILRTRPIPMPLLVTEKPDEILQLTHPGFHEPSGSYTFPPEWTPLPQPPTPVLEKGQEPKPINPFTPVSSIGFYDDKMTLTEAREFLITLLKDFPFNDWKEGLDTHGEPTSTSRSLACQIGAMLSLFGAALIPKDASRMGFLFNANSQRSGKTLLAQIAIITSFGYFSAQPWRHADEDMLKILDSETLAAANYICFDNVRGMLASQPLEALMTTPVWGGRVLGSTQKFEAENNAVVFVTGNNMNVGTDIAQRFLTIDLNIEEANVQDRPTPDLLINTTWLTKPANRHRILSSLWSLIRHWSAAGKPQASGKPYLGFEQWGLTIGGIVEFAGFGNMLERPVLANFGDTESQDITELIKLMIGTTFPIVEHTFQDVINILHENDLLTWKLKGREDWSPDYNKEILKLDNSANSSLGNLITTNYANGNKGRVYKFLQDNTLRHIRFNTNGKKGRQKRFVVEDLTPQPTT
jgi:hypothetical protein